MVLKASLALGLLGGEKADISLEFEVIDRFLDRFLLEEPLDFLLGGECGSFIIAESGGAPLSFTRTHLISIVLASVVNDYIIFICTLLTIQFFIAGLYSGNESSNASSYIEYERLRAGKRGDWG